MPSKEELIQEIELNIQFNVLYLSELGENMPDIHPMKAELMRFTEQEIEFMFNLKERIENGE